MTEDDGDPVAIWCAGDDWCPVTATATLIGKKWHPVIVDRLLVTGPMGFNALKEEVGGISSKVLSDSLSDLEESGLVEREIISEKPFRVEYSLTERGQALEPVIESMKAWGQEYLIPAESQDESVAST
jgi:DNA-binding HxlR family transcriptional regulator